MQVLHAAGIQVIVTLYAECYELPETKKQSSFKVLYLVVIDEAAPKLEELAEPKLLSWSFSCRI